MKDLLRGFARNLVSANCPLRSYACASSLSNSSYSTLVENEYEKLNVVEREIVSARYTNCTRESAR